MAAAAFPRASSAMSGFFLWGSADEPVVCESENVTHPNSLLDQRINSSDKSREMNHRLGHIEHELGHEVTRSDRIQGVVESLFETQSRGGRPRIEGEARPCRGASPERRLDASAEAGQAIPIAQGHPGICQ